MAMQPDLTTEQRANLAKLSAYLKTLPADYPKFAMNTFTDDASGAVWHKAHLPECGTAACAAGHGPAAGIMPETGETWGEYSQRCFVSCQFEAEIDDGALAWKWCFGAQWSGVDNTAHGAAARIDYMLAVGVPDDVEEQSHGHAPLCYTIEAAA